jgi:hypothetical protein
MCENKPDVKPDEILEHSELIPTLICKICNRHSVVLNSKVNACEIYCPNCNSYTYVDFAFVDPAQIVSGANKIPIAAYINDQLKSFRLTVTVEQLHNTGYSNEEIRSMTYNHENNIFYSAPSFVKLTDYDWVEKNFDKMVRMANGNCCYYFYNEISNKII